MFEVVQHAAPDRATVLILGESRHGQGAHRPGAARELPRRDRPVRQGELRRAPETLLESELFGHEKGAFTGANGRSEGRFELADGGTLFLDEIGEITPAIQVEAPARPAGARVRAGRRDETVKVDVRLVAATNRDWPRR